MQLAHLVPVTLLLGDPLYTCELGCDSLYTCELGYDINRVA